MNTDLRDTLTDNCMTGLKEHTEALEWLRDPKTLHYTNYIIVSTKVPQFVWTITESNEGMDKWAPTPAPNDLTGITHLSRHTARRIARQIGPNVRAMSNADWHCERIAALNDMLATLRGSRITEVT